MLSITRLGRAQIVIGGLFAIGLIAMIAGLATAEGDLPDRNAMYLLERGIQRGDIKVSQRTRLERLQAEIKPFNQLTTVDYQGTGDQSVILDQEQWRRVGQIVERFVAAENQAQAQVFDFAEEEDGRLYAVGFEARRFDYQNPFGTNADHPTRASIVGTVSNPEANQWTVLGRQFLLSLGPRARTPEVLVNVNSANVSGGCFAGQRAILTDGRNSIRLVVGPAPAGAALQSAGRPRTNLQISRLDASGAWSQPLMLNSEEYFVFGGETYVGFDRSSPGDAAPVVPLKFTKNINGSDVRVQPLGAATTNLLGIEMGGYADGLDGTVNHGDARRVDLTIDHEAQFCTAALMARELNDINMLRPIERRRGSATVIRADTGAIVAQVGLPARPLRQVVERRRVRVAQDVTSKDPATEIHMAGSTVKVLSVGLGFLLHGSARTQLLPRSNNDVAIQQAFHDAYGVAPGVSALTANGSVAPAFRERFGQSGTPTRVTPEFVRTVQDVFHVSPIATDGSPRADRAQRLTETVVPQALRRFFDERRLAENVYPEVSRFPMLDAEMVGVFRNYSLGTQDARFTTMRLASILATTSEGRALMPYLVSSVLDRNGTTHTGTGQAFSEISLPWTDVRPRLALMTAEMQKAMRAVLVPGGTGNFYLQRGEGGSIRFQYLGVDDPGTRDVDEGATRQGDIGKSGTADYDNDELQDSLFVYRHGEYVIAVWLEKADRGPNIPEAERPFLRHPAHRLTHRIVQWLEARGH